MKISKANKQAADKILKLQKLAYQSEAEIYDDFSIPPLIQTLEQIKKDFSDKYFLKAKIDGEIIGPVRAYQNNSSCHIGRLIVHPDFQCQGIGTKLMKKIEKKFGYVNRFELFTGHKSERNIRFYEKLGYHKFKEKPVTDNLTFIFMEKSA
jgi:ribosomal protein S18 acetylase RimI-like enzyme